MRQRTFFAAGFLLFVASCQGCFGCNSPIENPDLVLVRSCESAPPLIEPPKLDILFVIDNSNSMREEQEAVARELTAFIDQIKSSGGVPTDFNIGVITTAVYLYGRVGAAPPFLLNYPKQAGRLRPVPTALPDGGLDLEPASAERLLIGTDPELISKFSRLVQQGTAGSGQETPFEAVRLALLTDLITTPIVNGGNQEFLRDGARLLVVVLTDEDDCSESVRPPTVSVGDNASIADCTVNEMQLTTVSEYHRMFTEELKNADGTVKEVIWTAIAPVSTSSKAAMAEVVGGQVRNIDCPTSNQAGFRQRQMAEMFDTTLINLDSICQTNFKDTLVNIAELASVAQTIEIKNVPDEKLMQFVIVRKTGEVQNCTIANDGIVNFSRSTDGTSAKVQFGNQCRRRADDQSITIKMICAT